MPGTLQQLSSRRAVWFFTAGWLLVNLVQAAFTGLANDEAYYWMYARKLDIGYFDHPPMIALMIRAGDWLLHNELGLRLLTVVFSALCIPVLYRLTNRKDFPLLALLLCAVTVFQVYGFIAVPDAPLMLFTALFFLAYRNYLSNDRPKEILLLTLVIAGLLYSKYHGFLVLFFTLLSNLQLFRRKSFYAVIAGSALLYLPHIWWQIRNDYPSYQYHVVNKSQSSYDPLDSLTFLGGVLLIAGPLVSWLLVYATAKNREKDLSVRAMKITFFGFLLFFFASTFNAAVEPNWMAASVVPLVVVAHGYLSANQRLRAWAMRLSTISLAVFLFGRVNLVADLVPTLGSRAVPEFYGWREWAQELQKRAKGAPVVISNSYQKASKYSFYTRTEALSLNDICYRRNQYDLWDIVDSLQGRRVAFFSNFWPGRDSLETFDTPHGKVQLEFFEHFHSWTKLRIETEKDWYHFSPGTEVTIPLTFVNTLPSPVRFDYDAAMPVSLVCARYFYEKYDCEIQLQPLGSVCFAKTWKTTVKFRTPEKAGPYYLRFCVKAGSFAAYLNSHLIRMDVE